MNHKRRNPRLRLVIGAVSGALLAPAVVWLLGFGISPAEAAAMGSANLGGGFVVPEMAEAFASEGLAGLVQSLLGGLLGAVVSIATLPFADDGRKLILRSFTHFVTTALTFSLLLWVCRWVDQPRYILLWVALLAVLYAIIWLGRWVGWYVEVIQLRELLGLDPGPSPLKWRETLPYLPFLLLVCIGLPLALRWAELIFAVDVPVFSGLILPYLLLPTAGLFSGVSLGKRQGVCPLYPAACFLCYLPTVWLLFNSTALIHCFLISLPALAGNVLGWSYRHAVRSGE